VVVPASLVAVIVWAVEVCVEVGDPLNTQEVFMLIPGMTGEILQVVGVPPEILGVVFVMAWPSSKINGVTL
jgi:hypothetical protein